MTMIKCPECRHHISSMAKACPECGAPIDPEWAAKEAQKELKKLEEVPFTVEVGGEEVEPQPLSPQEGEENITSEDAPPQSADVTTPLPQEEKGSEAAPDLQKGKGGGAFFIVLVVLLGLIIGGLYFYDYQQAQKRELRAYELLQDCSNPEFYEDFIIRFPKSEHIDEIRGKLKEVELQQKKWLEQIASGTRDELQELIRLYPTSPYVKMAQTRIDSLDWAEASELRTIEAVTYYISTHPNGYYIDQAEKLRQTLERKRQEAAALAAARRDSLAMSEPTEGATE